jgi:hypothetical protein
MTFPYESVPDGAVFAPHHLYVGLLVAGFSFALVWRFYPVTGALGTLLGVLVALDDAVSHAFGVWTPLDWVWTVHVAQHIK